MNTWPVGKKQKNGSYHTFPLPQKWIFPRSRDYSPVTLTLSNLPLVVAVVEGGVNFSIFFSELLLYWVMKVRLLFWLMCDVLVEDNCGYSREKEAALLIVWGANCQDGLLTVHSFPIALHLLRTPSTKFFYSWLSTVLFVSLLPGQTVWALQQLIYFPNKYLLKYNYKPENKDGTSTFS